MKEEKINSRISYWDLGAGIMILWLLYYHALYPMYGREILNVFPYLFFFMPWFFYKSGYFYTPNPLKENAYRDARKLLKQFVVWGAIGYLCYMLHHYLLYDDVTMRMAFYTPVRSLLLGGAVWGNSALWFLLTLFFVRQVAAWLYPKYNTALIMVVSALLAWAIHFIDYQYMPGYVYTTAWGLCFFSAGYLLKQYEQNKWLILAALIILFVTFSFTEIPSVYKKEDTIEWYWYILWYPASIAGCVVFLNICRWIDMLGKRIFKNVQCDMPFPILKWVGVNAMTFYVAHAIICRITQEIIGVYYSQYYDSWIGLLIVIVAYIVIIVPLCFMVNMIKSKYECK